MATKGGLGRGLDSLIPKKKPDAKPVVFSSRDIRPQTNTPEDKSGRIIEVDIKKIVPNPHQPRRIFSHQDLEDLIRSIKEHGILQPITVTDKGDHYELIAGERRLRAATIAGLKKVPVIVRDAKEQEKLELALIENIQRSDLSVIEEARGYERLMSSFGLTQEEVAQKMGKSRPAVANALRLLKLPEVIQKAIEEKKITASHARAIASVSGEKEQLVLYEKIVAEGMNVRAVEAAGQVMTSRRRTMRIDPNIRAREEKLEGTLGTKVRIRKKPKGGEVIIEYYSDGDLDQIIKKIV